MRVRSGGREARLWIAASWLIAIGAAISHPWIEGVTANYAPIVLWCGLVILAASRIGRRAVWLLLAAPIAILSPVLWLFLLIALCYLKGFLGDRTGCF
jgi:hypothetical protein